ANVLVNDTLNGAPVTASQVNTTLVSSSNAGITLSGTTVNVAPGTPAGTYTLTYQICEILNPTNCDSAVVTVTVTAAPIDAVNNTYTVDCASIGTIGNILSNDTLNNAAVNLNQINLSIINGSYPNLSIDQDGNVSLSSIGHCGDYTFTYQICEKLNPTNCDTATVTVSIIDNTPPAFTTPDNVVVNTDANCNVNLDPTATGNVKNPTDNCDPNPTVTYQDNECFGNFNEGSINAGNGNYFNFSVTGFDNLTAANIEKVALAFETNQGKGRVQFTLVSPSGQGIVLVGPYCNGGNCDTNNTTESYMPVFYPNASGYPQWNNSNVIPTGIDVNLTPNGNLSAANIITGVTSYVSSFEGLTGPMNGNWFVYAQKVGNELGTIRFKSVCLTPASSCPNNRVVTRTWTVTDACGNSTKGTQTITIQDVTAPTWTTTAGSLNTTLECSNTAGLEAAQALAPTATDNCSGTVTYTKTSGAFVPSQGCTNAGTYTNTWTAKDVCNNISTQFTQIITIQDTTAPVWSTANGALNITIECSDAAALTSAQSMFPVATDLCDADVTNIVKKGGVFVPTVGCANTGTYTNTWTVTDACGNVSPEFTQTITVIDTTAPQITTAASNLVVQCDGSGNTGALEQWIANNGGAVASDSCSNVTWSNNFSSIANDCSAAVTVIFTATDGCGNASTTSATFTIEDTIAPNWSTQAGAFNTTVECSDAAALATAQAAFPVATDNCDGDVTNIVKTSGEFVANEGCTNAGTYTNTWTVADACGNTSAMFTQVITVQDTTAPTWTTAAGALDATVECSDAAALATAQAAFPIATDNCDGDV
ncbi:HYR-like domain-containing protein, partial [Flavobacterium sp. XGLA_31]|uniref:HYR-like domain-containing protein n=1 Tax=Flavobacterium sp. XGLA_31 TaxID=3447666 RepID=UPI003F3905E5